MHRHVVRVKQPQLSLVSWTQLKKNRYLLHQQRDGLDDFVIPTPQIQWITKSQINLPECCKFPGYIFWSLLRCLKKENKISTGHSRERLIRRLLHISLYVSVTTNKLIGINWYCLGDVKNVKKIVKSKDVSLNTFFFEPSDAVKWLCFFYVPVKRSYFVYV